MLSLLAWPKVITLSGFYCTTIILPFLSLWSVFRDTDSHKFRKKRVPVRSLVGSSGREVFVRGAELDEGRRTRKVQFIPKSRKWLENIFGLSKFSCLLVYSAIFGAVHKCGRTFKVIICYFFACRFLALKLVIMNNKNITI